MNLWDVNFPVGWICRRIQSSGVAFSYAPIDRLTSVTNATARIAYDYDHLGRRTRKEIFDPSGNLKLLLRPHENLFCWLEGCREKTAVGDRVVCTVNGLCGTGTVFRMDIVFFKDKPYDHYLVNFGADSFGNDDEASFHPKWVKRLKEK